MTPQKRAEKIVQFIYPNVDLWMPERLSSTDAEIREFIAQQIEEARSQALEDAAKRFVDICHCAFDCWHKSVIEEIRALKTSPRS